jgi:hypothetical protein
VLTRREFRVPALATYRSARRASEVATHGAEAGEFADISGVLLHDRSNEPKTAPEELRQAGI